MDGRERHRVDTWLRRMDTGRALSPYPIGLAAIAAVSGSGWPAPRWVFLVSAAATLVWARTTSAAAPAGVAPGVWA